MPRKGGCKTGDGGGEIPSRLANACGVSLLEVIVALVILSTVLLSLSGMMWQMGRQTRLSGNAAYRTAAVESGAALAHAVPWDSLSAVAGCATDSSSTLAYTRCIDVIDVAPDLRQVRIVITPTNVLPMRPDTVAVYRTRPLLPNPLDVQ